jgi:hypothetical protein
VSELRFRMQTWLRRNDRLLSDISAAMETHALEAGWEGDYPDHDEQVALRGAGTRLLEAVRAARQAPPMPAPDAQALFTSMLNNYEAAALMFSAPGFGTHAGEVREAAGLADAQALAPVIQSAVS